MPRNRETTDVQQPALLAVGRRPDVLAWRQQSGLFRQFEPPHRPVRVGVPGLSDAMLVVAVEITQAMVGRTLGVALAAEFKRAQGRQSRPQQAFQRAVEQRGGAYVVVRSAAELEAAVTELQALGYITKKQKTARRSKNKVFTK